MKNQSEHDLPDSAELLPPLLPESAGETSQAQAASQEPEEQGWLSVIQESVTEWYMASKLIWPHMLLTGLLTFGAISLQNKLTTGSAFGGPSAVVFDIIKYSNAQRALASKLVAGEGGQGDAAMLLRDVNTRTLGVVQEVAQRIGGKNVTVLVRQSVISAPNAFDITDEVLKELALPTDVPTAASFTTEAVTSLNSNAAVIAHAAKSEHLNASGLVGQKITASQASPIDKALP